MKWGRCVDDCPRGNTENTINILFCYEIQEKIEHKYDTIIICKWNVNNKIQTNALLHHLHL